MTDDSENDIQLRHRTQCHNKFRGERQDMKNRGVTEMKTVKVLIKSDVNWEQSISKRSEEIECSCKVTVGKLDTN